MYKLEIFDDQMVYAAAVMLSQEQTIEQDYLAYDAYTVTVPKHIPCKKGWYTHITDGAATVADGIVADVQPGDGTMSISIRPLAALMDVEVYQDTSIDDCIGWLTETITAQFVSNPDTAQTRPLVLTQTAARTALPLSVEPGVINLLGIVKRALTTHRVVVDCRLDMAALKVAVSIRQETAERTLEASLPNVIGAPQITLGDSYGAANKAILRRVDADGNLLGTYTYYLHTDGTVSDVDADRVTPVFWTIQDIGVEDAPASVAGGILGPKQYDNEIILTYRTGDLIARPLELPIGAKVAIRYEGQTYNSMLTGRAIRAGMVDLIFGQVRMALTKRLILERRT